MTNNVEA